MERLCLFFVLAILSSGVLGLSITNKRQAEEDKDLENRFGWNRPNRPDRGRFSDHFHRRHYDQFIPFPDQIKPIVVTAGPIPNVIATTTRSITVEDCIRTCPVTSEYNPVCGSNLITYDNPGRFRCAQACGLVVALVRASRCPQTTTAPSV